MDLNLYEPIMEVIGTGILGAISVAIVLLNKRLASWFLKHIWSNISHSYKHGKIKKQQIERDSKIREILVELRIRVNADRTCLQQFHNGNVFSTNNPIWRFSCTHESVSPGISSEIGRLQDIKASTVIETLRVLWNEDYPSGITKISPEACQTCPTKCHQFGRKLIFIDVKNLEDGYSKSIFKEQGIKYALKVPIYKGENCVGFVAANYCSECDEAVLHSYARELCENAFKIQFMLEN